MPHTRKPLALSRHGKNQLSLLRPALFPLPGVQNSTDIPEFARDFYSRKLQEPQEFLKFWSGNATIKKLKKQRKKLEGIIRGYLFFLKWGRDPDPRYSTFIRNLWSGLDFDDMLAEDRAFAIQERQKKGLPVP
ncbi:hypothetical protein K435DRAFT_798511 [Dendrothele bispora CBS 962.96]|uniref:Uncharacterized protein n=1 Tax=Dendrothele bispora (strain CBS 962.96) TaxID=1314807 RepID=A0A4S8LYY4_DENBC|nr:hypothetical protein K435DRAFT_798511 [Dendrothele bispora CBS 962.96]